MSSKSKRPTLPPHMIGVPVQSWLYAESAVALMNLYGAAPRRSAMVMNSWAGSSIAGNRNNLVLNFLARRHLEFLLFVDSDMTPPPDAGARLWRAALDADADVVGGLYFNRRPPFAAEVLFLPGHPFHCNSRATAPRSYSALTGVHEVARIGFGCTLVTRRALEALPAPAFEHTEPGWGEDYLFCDKVRGAGGRVALCADVRPGHLAVSSIGADHWELLGGGERDGQIAAARWAASLCERGDAELAPIQHSAR